MDNVKKDIADFQIFQKDVFRILQLLKAFEKNLDVLYSFRSSVLQRLDGIEQKLLDIQNKLDNCVFRVKVCDEEVTPVCVIKALKDYE